MYEFFIGLLFAVVVYCLFALVRNQCVYWTRNQFINAPDFPRAYHALPDYYEMVLHPKYWLLWTHAHWRAWLTRREQP